MEETQQKKVMAFDNLFTTNRIQILKILLSYMAPSTQKTLAIYIKFLELQYTLTLFQNYPDTSLLGFDTENTFDISKLCSEILPFCGRDEQEKILQMRSMMENFDKKSKPPPDSPFISPKGAPSGNISCIICTICIISCICSKFSIMERIWESFSLSSGLQRGRISVHSFEISNLSSCGRALKEAFGFL